MTRTRDININSVSFYQLDYKAIWSQIVKSNHILKPYEGRDLTACPICDNSKLVFFSKDCGGNIRLLSELLSGNGRARTCGPH